MAQPYTLKLGSVDLSNYIRLNADDGFDPYDQDGFDEPAFSGAPFAEGHPLTNVDAGNREMSWPLYLNTASKDTLHALITQINNEIANPTASPLRVEWKDIGASNSTYYDVTYARFDPNFNYRRGSKNWLAGTLHIFCAPPFGHTATERILASVFTATQPNMVASLIGVGSSVQGDVPAQARVTVTMSGSQAPGPAGRGLVTAALPASGYIPFISAASFVNLHPSAGVFGASGAPGSQAIYRHPYGDSGRIAQVGLGVTPYAGRNRVFAAVLPGAYHIPLTLAAIDQAGQSLGPTAIAYRADGWQMVDLGVVSVPTVTATTRIDIYIDRPYKTANDQIFYSPLPSGAAASTIGAIAGIFVLPENTIHSVIDRCAKPLVRSYFGASGGATGIVENTFVGDLGETYYNQSGNQNFYNASGGMFLQLQTELLANVGEADSFRARAIMHPLGIGAAYIGARRVDGNSSILAFLNPTASVSLLNIRARTASNAVNIGSLVIASQAGMSTLTGASQALVVELERRDKVIVLNARLTNATGIGIIPSAGMAATVVPVACVAATSTLSNSISGAPFIGYNVGGAANTLFTYFQFDALTSNSQASEAYRLTGVTGDTPMRSPIAGSGPNISLQGAVRGPAIQVTPSTVGIAIFDWMLDGGPMNDINSIEVRVRERYRYAR